MKRSDLCWAALLFVGAVLYGAAQPPNLGAADESVYLYQAKRVLEGAVPYRDVFDLTTPGWLYVVAGLYSLFGVSLSTARLATAVLHGLTGVMLYACCRRLSVRPSLSWPAALAYLVVCVPAWPIASQHWLATALCVLLLLLCAGLPGPRAAWAMGPGLVVGALIAVHQQRGALVGAGVAVWLIADRLIARRSRTPRAGDAPSLLGQLGWLAAGAGMIVVPMLVALVAVAGFEPVWQALVLHPLFNYRGTMRATWGSTGVLMADAASFTFPPLLRYLPVVVLPAALRAILLLRRGERGVALRRLCLLIVFALTAVASIAYYPDYIHIAFIAPIFFVAAGELAEHWLGPAADRVPALRLAGWAAAAGLLIAAGVRLEDNIARTRALYPVQRDTAFGRVSLARPIEGELVDTLQGLLRDTPTRELFCYPIVSYLYLMLDADNPTRFQFLLPGYTSPEQLREVVGVLQAKQLPYIVVLPGFLKPDDPVMAFLKRDYEPLSDNAAIYRRRGI